MPVKIRLTRKGKKKQPSYRVVVVDSRKPRDGAYIEQIGRYDPRQDPSLIEIDNERALDWLGKGAQPTERARKLLEISGAWTRFRVAKGDIHTVGDVPEPPAPKAAAAEAAGAEEAVVEEVVAEPEIIVEEAVAEEAVAEPEIVEEEAVVEAAVAEPESAAEEASDDER
jgi:small subunit ribosomal protein S16